MSAHDASDHDQGGLLSDATLAALQLHHQPFFSAGHGATVADPISEDDENQSFIDTITEEQLADVKQAIITGDDLLLILGETGAGKTTLLRQLNAQSGLRIQCFSVTGSERFSTRNLFSGMLEAFKIPPPEKLKDILDELIPCLQSMVARNTLSAIVLDDADKVSKTELTQLLSGMLYMNSQDETLMRVALAAPAEFEDLIPELLPEGADLPYSSLTIEGFSPRRAAAYLDHRLALAGFDQEFPFTERDMASLIDHSGGRPAALHALTADVLNEKYGKLEANLPSELIREEGSGFLQSRMGKLALGALATLLIIGGLLMFMPAREAPRPTPIPESVDVAESGEQTPTVVSETTPETLPETPQEALPDTTVVTEETQSTDQSEPRVSIGQTTDSPASTSEGTESTPVSTITDTDSTGESSPTDQNTDSAGETPATDTNTVAAASTTELENNQPDANDDAENTASTEVQAESAVLDTGTSTDTGTDTVTDTDTATESTREIPIEQAEADVQSTPAPTNEAPQPASVVNVDDELAALLESPSWILVQDEALFTIQMSASRDLESVQNFLRRNPLPGPNSIFSFERDGDVWYALVHGIYPAIQDAQRAVEQMNASARRDQPWIRSIGRLKQILREP